MKLVVKNNSCGYSDKRNTFSPQKCDAKVNIN